MGMLFGSCLYKQQYIGRPAGRPFLHAFSGGGGSVQSELRMESISADRCVGVCAAEVSVSIEARW